MTFSPAVNGARPVVPVPENAPPIPMSHHVLGRPTAVWTYRDARGQICFNVLRFDRSVNGLDTKTMRPLSCVETAEGRIEWRYQQAPAPRVLFNLPALVADSNAVVVIAEGEKAAEAAGRLMPGCVATTSSGGSNAAAQTDWSALRGRECILVPDHDEPGRKYAGAVGEILRDVGVTSLRVLDIAQIGAISWRDGQEIRRSLTEIPKGYDLADAEQDGWTADALLNALETFPDILKDVGFAVSSDQVFSPQIPGSDPEDDPGDSGNFVCAPEGVFKRVVTYDKRTKRRSEELIRICGCLEVIGFARTKKSKDWGRMIEFADPDVKKKQLVVSGADFAGNGTDVAKRLISEGLSLVPTRAVLEMLTEYILTSTPKRRITFTQVPGWCGSTFALPGKSYGPDDVICDLGEADHPYVVSGSFADWQEIPRLALGNSRLIFALCVAFAGPLLVPCGFESGGFILVSSTGDGKTTLLRVAGAVWGGREGGDYCASWSGSDSGLEGIAVRSSGTLLALDEIGTVDPRLLGAVTYMILNGRGKNRADVRGRLLSSAAWSCMLLATGEQTLAELIDDPLRGRRSTAGQKVRLVDVPADVPGASGVFEELHDFPSSRAFSDHLRTLSTTHFGHAGRAFLAKRKRPAIALVV
ncbi:DUF927 domain-containing protein [Rhodobacter capsulatus]|uniref:DUF927 domain-containing protein n=1 Tax=Rhodobacter capsulatus TaxID=1061 RepID=UPI00402A41F1